MSTATGIGYADRQAQHAAYSKFIGTFANYQTTLKTTIVLLYKTPGAYATITELGTYVHVYLCFYCIEA